MVAQESRLSGAHVDLHRITRLDVVRLRPLLGRCEEFGLGEDSVFVGLVTKRRFYVLW